MSDIARPTRIGVRRGATIPLGRFENVRVEFYAETDLPSGLTVQDAERDLSRTLEELLAEEKKRIQSTGPAQPPGENQLTAQALDRLPWKLYREGHRAGWIFTEKAPKPLVDRLEQEDKSIVIGDFRYRFSGPDEQPKLFVSRAPVEEKH
jgi:hypothetical protein